MYAEQLEQLLEMLFAALIIAEFQELRYILGVTQFTQSPSRHNARLLKGLGPRRI